MRHARILSTGSYVPERVVTNAEVDALIGELTSEWLIENVGIRERRWMAANQNTSDLVVEAATRALDRAGFATASTGFASVRASRPLPVRWRIFSGARRSGCERVRTCRLSDGFSSAANSF